MVATLQGTGVVRTAEGVGVPGVTVYSSGEGGVLIASYATR